MRERAADGYSRQVTSTVHCGRCGAVYETEAPPAAIREVNRCRDCGGPLAIDGAARPVRPRPVDTHPVGRRGRRPADA